MAEHQSLPLKRQEGLMVEAVETEVLVYDVERAQANCLNQTAALVWQNADGKTSVPQLAQKLSNELSAPVDEGVVWYALDQLQKKHLLAGEFQMPVQLAATSRREFLKRAALVGAVVAIPAVVSMVAPTPAQAATCLSGGSLCRSNADCCSGVCEVVCAA